MRTKVGLVGIWNRPDDPRLWSGVQHQLIKALTELDAFGGYLDATPWPPMLRAWRVGRRLVRARDEGSFLDAVPQAILSTSNVYRRAASRAAPDRWLVPATGIGRPVGGRIASLSEMPPELIQQYWRDVTPAQVRRLAAQQVRLYRAATVCCVTSRWCGQGLVEDAAVDPGKIQVVGYGPNLVIEPPDDRDWSAPRFLWSGLDWKRKNGERVIRAFARLRESRPDAELDIVGDHPRIDVPGVTAHGHKTIHETDGRALIETLYRRATCFVMPSLVEPFGVVYVEAARCGLASIGTTNGGTADSVGDGGVLVDPLDDDAIFEAMERMARPEQASSLGTAARARSHDFSWRKTAERIVRALAVPGEDVSDLAEPL